MKSIFKYITLIIVLYNNSMNAYADEKNINKARIIETLADAYERD